MQHLLAKDHQQHLLFKDHQQHQPVKNLYIHTDDYVVVSYAGDKTVVHYIGLVLDAEDEDGDTEVRFLRKAHKVDNVYVDPVVEDIDAV